MDSSPRRLVLAALLLAFVGTAGAVAHARFIPTDGPVLPGLTIDRASLGSARDPADVTALVDRLAEAVLSRRVALVPASEPKRVLSEPTLAELGVTIDRTDVVARATRFGRSGDLIERAEAAARARRGEIDVPLAPRVDRAVALRRLEQLKEAEDTPAQSARMDVDKHVIVPERAGRYLDAWAAIAEIERAAADPSLSTIVVPEAAIAPRVTGAFLKSLDVRRVMGTWETHFSRAGEQRHRARNVEVAARKLDGSVLRPGELFSFNEVVGARSEDNGFEKGWEIFKGEMVEGVGGGTCQVASTFHAAVFFSGLEVLERLPHSRPSAYIPMGLDSTVVYPAVDLKVRNPHAFPVLVHAKVTGNALKIELLGPEQPVHVAFERELVKTWPYKRKVVEDEKVTGHVVLKQHGIDGFRIKRRREIVFPDGSRKKEETEDTYPSTTEIYEVPPGFDVALLPPLPGDTAAVAASAEEAEAIATPSAEGDAPAASALAAGAAGAVACAGACPPAPASGWVPVDVKKESQLRGLDIREASGAHAPTPIQAVPPKELKIRR